MPNARCPVCLHWRCGCFTARMRGTVRLAALLPEERTPKRHGPPVRLTPITCAMCRRAFQPRCSRLKYCSPNCAAQSRRRKVA